MACLLGWLVCWSATALAQDCQLKKTTDEFTREPKLSTGFFTVQNVTLSIDADKRDIDFFFSVGGHDKCFDTNSELLILFEGNRTKNLFRNSGSMNCDGLFHVTVHNGPEAPYILKRLSTLKVASLKFTGNNKSETLITLNPAQQQLLMNQAACMARDAGTLVQ